MSARSTLPVELPPSWKAIPLRALARRRDETDRPDLPLLSVYRDLGVVERQGREDNFNKPGMDLSTYRVVYPGDLVLNKMKTWQGSLGVSDLNGIVSPAYFVCELTDQVDRRFLHYLLRSRPYVAEYAARSKGIRPAQWDLPWDEFKSILVATPPPEVQRRIAAFLDRETARIDAAFAARTRLLELIREKWTAWVSDLTDNQSWPQIRLKRLLSRPLEYGIGEAAEYDEAGWPRYIRTTDVTVDGDLRDETFKSLPPEIAGPYLLAGGDLLFTRSGATVGKSFLYREQWGSACFAGYLIRARVDRSKVLPQFLSYFVQSKAYWSQIKLLTLQATIPNVSAERYGDIVVRVPTLADQEQVVKRLREVAGRISDLRNHLLSQVTLLREHRKALITATVTGQIHLSEAATSG